MSHIAANVEIRSISDDETSSVSSFPRSTRDLVETMHDADLFEYPEGQEVTTDEMIAEAIRGGPQISDLNMDGCTNVTIGNQTHIKGTVIIRNVLTRSEAICGKNDEELSSSSDFSKDTETGDGYKGFGLKSSRSRRILILSAVIILSGFLLAMGITLIILFSTSENSIPVTTFEPSTTLSTTEIPSTSSTMPSTIPPTTPETTTPEITTTTPFPLTIVRRRDWNQTPNHANKNLSHPAEEIFIAHTGDLLKKEFPNGCSTKKDCTSFAVKMEEYYIKKAFWDDLPYNFFLGHDGLLYEGRGWRYDGSLTSAFQGDDCISIGFIGDYTHFDPTDEQIQILFAIIDLGIEKGYISPNYKIFGHCQASNSKSPGKRFYENLQSWNNWSNYSSHRVLNECKFE
ncbi:uncharacterized protein LOC134829843 [Culicoides brevitarsis]|uniref:uncharacterized protein LOC134829843 n=1 Tax=Culicoides brevitarsis TaxID=469753 RepID=UPI00307CADBF